jgi:methoxymalonate biosynthesis acyl carrier protein
MTTSDIRSAETTDDAVESAIVAFLNERLSAQIDPEQDLFETGLVNSMFAMEIVVHIESTFDVAVVGPDLRLENFRTARSMSAMVERLRDEDDDDDL